MAGPAEASATTEFLPVLAALAGGLLAGIVLVDALVDWYSRLGREFREGRRLGLGWTRLGFRSAAASIRHRGPWLLAVAAVLVAMLPDRPFAAGFVAGVLSWPALAVVVTLAAVAVSWICVAFARWRAGKARRDGDS